MVLIDPYEVYLEKTFGESHQVNNNPFGVLCEGSGQPLEFNFNLNSGESLSFSSKSHPQSLPNFSSSSFHSSSHFLPQSSFNFSLVDNAIISLHSHIYISPLERWIEESCNPTYNCWRHVSLLIHYLHLSSILESQIIEIPPCTCLILNVSLFWHLAKNKGRHSGISKLIEWLDWIFDST